MSQNIRVSRDIEFVGDATQENNVKGYMAEDKISRVWDFTELTLDGTNQYTLYIDTDSAVAVGTGGATFTTLATDTRTASMALGGIFWYPAKNPVCEFRFKIDIVTTASIYAGFTDATSEATSLLPFGITTATLTDTCNNGAGFLFDTLQTLAYFNIVNTNAGTEGFTQLASIYVPVAATNVTVRVALDSSGNADYFWNGTHIGRKLLAVHTTTPLVPYFGIRNNAAVAHVATLRRVRAWCDQ